MFLSLTGARAKQRKSPEIEWPTVVCVWSIGKVSLLSRSPCVHIRKSIYSMTRKKEREREHSVAFPFELEPVDGLLSRLNSENDLSNVPIRRLGSDSENDGYHTFPWLWNNRSERFTCRMLMYATATDQETWQVLCKHTHSLGAKACCLSIGNERWSSHSYGNEAENKGHARTHA